MTADTLPADHCVALGLGGNGPTTEGEFRNAVRALRSHSAISSVVVSRLFGTAAIGNAESRFLNACALIETSLSLDDLLSLCKQLERDAGRQVEQVWGNRPLDVDVLLSDQLTANQADLVVPHRWMHVRRFVLDPLRDIWPEQRHPVFGRSVTDLRNHWLDRPLKIAIDSDVGLSASTVEAAFGDAVRIEKSCESAHLTLSVASTDTKAWPPQINLGEWPMLVDEAAIAAIRSVLDAPETVGGPEWSE